MEDGPPIFKQDITCPALLVVSLVPQWSFKVRDYHPLRLSFPEHSPNFTAITNWLFRVRSPLLTKSRLISFPRVLRCFSSPGLPHTAMYSLGDSRFFTYWVSPFGHLGLNASYRLIQAFRRLARPSSPLIAKASTLCA